jgi:tetratricopeptide (TPR) repeat protein
MSDLPNLSILLDRAHLLLFQMKRYQEAEILLQQCLSIDPRHAPTHAMLAINYAHTHRGELAIESAKKAIELAPDDSYTHYALARVYRCHGLITKSECAIITAITINPEIAEYFAVQADNYIIQGQLAKALNSLNIGLKIDPKHIYCLQLKLRTLIQLCSTTDAEKVANFLLSLSPDRAITHCLVGHLYQLQNKNQQSIAAYKESLRLDPLQPDLQILIQVYMYQ